MRKYQYYIFLVIFLIITLIMLFIKENAFNKKMSVYRKVNLDDEFNTIVSSALYVDKWYIINDSLTFNAISIENDSLRLSDYLEAGDYIIKKKGQDTITLIQGHQIIKFNLILVK